MLSPQLRQKVFDLWSMFWSSGMTNPLTSIEQITYLLFLKRLEALDNERVASGKLSIYGKRKGCKLQHRAEEYPDGVDPAEYDGCPGHETCKWSYIKNTTDQHDLLSQYVFPWLRELDDTLAKISKNDNGIRASSKQMEDAYFQLPKEKTATLQRAISAIDDLFKQVDTRGANADIMGDIFEYLLGEIQTSGKNGQFRTPRHIIRFMIELLDPKPGELILDPAAGTGGFLINSIQHLLKENTDPETLVLEWDGTPHRAFGGDLDLEHYLAGGHFTGYDNDRTMVRIGWMNMILHGIENPQIERRDSLSKNLPDTETGKYDVILANPPFTGSVDTEDLHDRFPRKQSRSSRSSGNGPSEAITNKTELLFVWLILDLLKPGGRAAVIVPEGVLFGSTTAHKALRRQLLFENRVEAVISLPGGVFQPYTNVKTSILVFSKVGELAANNQPQTKQVWFYEVEADGYTLDAKRNNAPEPNDLWDALAKWPNRVAASTDYYKPDLFPVRWRIVDEGALKVFPELETEHGNVLGIHELFRGLPSDPDEATQAIIDDQQLVIQDLLEQYLNANARSQREVQRAARDLRNRFNEPKKRMLYTEHDQFASNAIDDTLKMVIDTTIAGFDPTLTQGSSSKSKEPNWDAQIEAVVREFAKLDGYNVTLRSQEIECLEGHLEESKSWVAPVRAFARNDEWQSSDNQLTGSHDEHGNIRPEFLNDTDLYDSDKGVKSAYLEPDCIEANDLNLSAGRYKPFVLSTSDFRDPSVIIRELQEIEDQIQSGLKSLLAMVEGN